MKKFLAIVLALALMLSVVSIASASSLAGEYNIKVWVADAIKDLTISQIEKFNETNTDGIKFIAEVQSQGEGEAATNMVNDIDAGADIYCFAQDQFARLLTASALAKLGKGAADTVTANYDEGGVKAITSGETLYAYPLSADNDFFMYYDKSIIPEDAVGSFEKLIEICEENGKYFGFDLKNAWYNASFFFATGCHSDWTTDDAGNIIGVNDNFNSDKGLVALKGMKKLVDSKAWLSTSEVSSFESGAAIVVSGIWYTKDAQKILGDNYGVAPLPSFEVDGTAYPLTSYFGFKLMGVKPQPADEPAKAAALHRLAQFLTGKECSLERFEAVGWGPANLEAQAEEAVKNDPALIVVAQQREHSVLQSAIHGSWWDIGKVIAEEIQPIDLTDEDGLKAVLQNYEDKMTAVFNMTNDEKLAWTVIGTCNLTDGFFYTDYTDETRSNWADDIPMVKGDDGLWRTEQAWEMEEGVEFKVRQGKSWDVSYGDGGNNFKVTEAGTYYVVFDEAATTITLEKAE